MNMNDALKYFSYPFMPHVAKYQNRHFITLALNKRDIMRYIPLRDDSLMVDEAIVNPDPFAKRGYIRTRFSPPEKSSLFNGHFPSTPVLKGVLTLELMNVAAMLLGMLMFPEIKVLLSTFKNVTEFECSGSPIVPGDILTTEVNFLQLEKKRQFLLFSFTGTVKRDSKIVAKAKSFTGTVIAGK